MIGDHTKFTTLRYKSLGTVAFGNNGKLKVIGIGNIELDSDFIIRKVLLVENFKYNLLSISQLCDARYKVRFMASECQIKNLDNPQIQLRGFRQNNIYVINLASSSVKCHLTQKEETWLWHRRMSHTHFRNINKLNGLVRGLPKLPNIEPTICNACQQGKQTKSTHKSTNQGQTKSILELIHLDLFDSHGLKSINDSLYCLVIIDDFSRFTWVKFLKNKDETNDTLINFCKQIENEKDLKIKRLRSDNGGEFKNKKFNQFCLDNGYHHEFSCPKTPQQNGIVERKNRTLQEATRTMLNEYQVPKYLWAEAVNTACYVQNRITINKIHNKTPFELFYQIIPNIKYFKVFGCPVFILNTREYLGKFTSKVENGIFVGYSLNSRVYRIYNKNTLKIEETTNIKFDEFNKSDLTQTSYEPIDFVRSST
ncbi:DDE-type integrase/transposase/recombinase, partial [Salmonella enterica]|nr:DDE-type integrase/transposase/recombinase [Salmonella enterica]